MNKLMAFFKKLRLRQYLSVLMAGFLLIVSTACSSVTASGANPENPAVQAGGANNPYKGGGDGYTNLKTPTDIQVNPKSEPQANQINFQQLMAAVEEPGVQYPGSETPAGRAMKQAELPIKTQKNLQEPNAGGLNQRNPDLGERIENRIEAVKDAFKDASGFIKDKADEAGERPELQVNPALSK